MKSAYFNFVLTLLAIMTLCGCQQERLSITESQEDNLNDDSNLVGLVQGVTAHDGSIDDVVDDSSCFSINFPYYCEVDGEVFYYEQANDLRDLYLATEIKPVFPITVTYADYGEIEVNSNSEYEDLIALCANGFLYNEAIVCVDFIYPIEIAVFDTRTSNFETVLYDHDRITFTGLRSLMLEGRVMQIQFPVQIQVIGGETLQIDSNEQLKAVISSNLDFCF